MHYFASDEQETFAHYTERLALRLAAPSGLLLCLVIILANSGRNPVPLVGDWQAFGRLFVISILLFSLVTGGTGYILGTRAWNERVTIQRRRTWKLGVV